MGEISKSAPLVSVAMITYNHERFITTAVESVLAQRTKFPIELVIGDDASSDGTRQRIELLKSHAPEIIRMLNRSTNIGMHGNLEEVLQQCRGEFVAFLEGDDYWISDEKLQVQADILRKSDRIVGVFHRVKIVDARGKETDEICPDRLLTEIGTQELLTDNISNTTASVMIRREALVDLRDCYRKLNMRDWPMWVFASLHGPWLCLPQVMAAYRVHDRGNWNGLSGAARLDSRIEALRMFAADLPRPFPDFARQQLARLHLDALKEAVASDRPADARRELREVVRRFSCYRVRDTKRLASALWQFLSPQTHSVAKRALRRIQQNLVHRIP